MHTALGEIYKHMEEVKSSSGGGVLYCFDLKKAFSSGCRVNVFKDLCAKFPGDKFLIKLKNVYNNLKLHVALGFTDASNVEVDYLRGVPEGSCAAANLFTA